MLIEEGTEQHAPLTSDQTRTIVIRPPEATHLTGGMLPDKAEIIEFPLTPTRIRGLLDRLTGGRKDDRPSPASPEPAIGPASSPARVLLVEDFADSAVYVKRVLRKAGHTVTLATKVAEAIAAARQTFDIILMDLLLPDGSGLDAARAIRDIDKELNRERTPIIALTAHALQGYRELAYLSEMDGYLTKPIRPAMLLSVVEKRAVDRNGDRHAANENPDRVVIGADVADLIPGFLKSIRLALEQVRKLLPEGRLDEIARHGHNLKGSGATYGFAEITRRGGEIESAARAGDAKTVDEASKELARYLDRVRWQTGSE